MDASITELKQTNEIISCSLAGYSAVVNVFVAAHSYVHTQATGGSRFYSRLPNSILAESYGVVGLRDKRLPDHSVCISQQVYCSEIKSDLIGLRGYREHL